VEGLSPVRAAAIVQHIRTQLDSHLRHSAPEAVKDAVVAASSWPPVSLLGAGLEANAARLSV
jgi:hypothetical protein